MTRDAFGRTVAGVFALTLLAAVVYAVVERVWWPLPPIAMFVGGWLLSFAALGIRSGSRVIHVPNGPDPEALVTLYPNTGWYVFFAGTFAAGAFSGFLIGAVSLIHHRWAFGIACALGGLFLGCVAAVLVSYATGVVRVVIGVVHLHVHLPGSERVIPWEAIDAIRRSPRSRGIRVHFTQDSAGRTPRSMPIVVGFRRHDIEYLERCHVALRDGRPLPSS